jgi:hypothetical protein
MKQKKAPNLNKLTTLASILILGAGLKELALPSPNINNKQLDAFDIAQLAVADVILPNLKISEETTFAEEPKFFAFQRATIAAPLLLAFAQSSVSATPEAESEKKRKRHDHRDRYFQQSNLAHLSIPSKRAPKPRTSVKCNKRRLFLKS